MPKHLSLMFAVVFVASCTHGHCRSKSAPPPPPKDVIEEARAPQSEEKVWVFKYDGSRYCASEGAISLEEMAKELADETHIFSAKKMNDGLMRTQVCGNSTGNANVYEIPAADLQRAEELGFKRWTYDGRDIN